jgi:hypothetical protein
MVGQEKTLAAWSWLGWYTLSGQMRMLVSECAFLALYEHILCYFSTYMPCILMCQSIFYSPTDAQLNCLKKILKFTLKLTLKQLQHVAV